MKYIQIDEEREQNDVSLNKSNELFSFVMEKGSSEEDSNNIMSKDAFDEDMLSKKNVQRHATISVRKGNQQMYPPSKSNCLRFGSKDIDVIFFQ